MDRQFMKKKTHTFFQKGIPFLEMIGTLMEEVCLLQRKTTILIQPPQNYKEPVKSSGAKWKSIHLCSYYHPKTSNEECIDQLAKSLKRASSIKNSFIVVAGDFNLPGWSRLEKQQTKTQQSIPINPPQVHRYIRRQWFHTKSRRTDQRY